MKALQIAALGMIAQQHKTEVVANNLANMNTTGYQRRRTEFSDLLYTVAERKPSASSRAGETVPGGMVSGQGVQVVGMVAAEADQARGIAGAGLLKVVA